MTTQPENMDKAEQKVAKDELSEKELEKATGGSSSSGAGAGKVTFNPFSVTRKTDMASP
jgi:hypothetical protein